MTEGAVEDRGADRLRGGRVPVLSRRACAGAPDGRLRGLETEVALDLLWAQTGGRVDLRAPRGGRDRVDADALRGQLESPAADQAVHGGLAGAVDATAGHGDVARVAGDEDDATAGGFGPSLLRNLLRVVDFLPLMYLTGIITSLFNAQFKRLGDLVAGTLVVYDADPIPDPNFDVKGHQPVPADFTTDEHRALLALAERSKRFSRERQSELAAILLPVLKTDEPVIAIKQMANSMVGRQ